MSVGRAWVLVCALAVFAAGCRNGERLREAAAPGPGVGAALPVLELRDLGGQPAGLDEFRGRTVLLNLWATWCLPCRDEMPELQELQERYAPDELTVVGISIDHDGPEIVLEFLEEHAITYPNLMAAGAPLLAALGLEPGVPHTLLVDRTGVVRGYWRGRFRPFDPDVQGLIAEVVADGSGGAAGREG